MSVIILNEQQHNVCFKARCVKWDETTGDGSGPGGSRRRLRTTYPRLGPLGTRNGATTPTSPHSVVKQIIGSASEWETMAPVLRGSGAREEAKRPQTEKKESPGGVLSEIKRINGGWARSVTSAGAPPLFSLNRHVIGRGAGDRGLWLVPPPRLSALTVMGLVGLWAPAGCRCI